MVGYNALMRWWNISKPCILREYEDAEKHNELLVIEIIDTFYKLWAQRKVLYDPEPYPLEWIPEQYNRYFPPGLHLLIVLHYCHHKLFETIAEEILND